VIVRIRVIFVAIQMLSPFANVLIALVKAIFGVEKRLTFGRQRREATAGNVFAQPVVVLVAVQAANHSSRYTVFRCLRGRINITRKTN
jgi:hypothetical protein